MRYTKNLLYTFAVMMLQSVKIFLMIQRDHPHSFRVALSIH